MSGGSAVLKIDNFKAYRSDIAIDISVKKKCNVLVGKNGSGETTLLDYTSGLKKEKGAMIAGNEGLVYMNQSMFFFGRLRVHEFVKFFYRPNNIKDYRRTLVSFNGAYENRLNLGKLQEKQIGVLSEGEKKLLYFLLIMSLDRSWHLLDEPFAGIGEDGRKLMCEIVNKGNSEHREMIIVLHEMEMLRQLDDYNVMKLDLR